MKIVNEEKSWLEWVVFVLSALLIAAVTGFLVYDGAQDEGRPPEIHVTLGRPAPSPHGCLVPVTVTNKGDETAQELEVEVTTAGEPPEQASLTFDFLSSGEVRDGWVGFSRMPTGELKVRVVGYRSKSR